MFALEVEFSGASSPKETVFIRRPQVLIGADELSHIVLTDLNNLDFQILLTRDIGRRFHIQPIPIKSPQLSELSKICDASCDKSVSLDLKTVKLRIVALDIDVTTREDETYDKASIRSLRQACSSPSPKLPAVSVAGHSFRHFTISFADNSSLLVGRGKACSLRIDAPEISTTHARFGCDGGNFWVEDLGSTNGTFIGQQQVSGRVNVDTNVSVRLGRNFILKGIYTKADIISKINPANEIVPIEEDVRYPALVSASSIARPARVTVKIGATIRLGRDQSSDMWLGAPHISRMHSTVVMNDRNEILFSDFSTNGTTYENTVLKRGDSILLKKDPKVFNFGSDITVAVCFNKEQELKFLNSKGDFSVFTKTEPKKRLLDDHISQKDSDLIIQKKDDLIYKNLASNLFERMGTSGLLLVTLSIGFVLFILLGIWKGI